MKKITFTTALLASACAFAGFEGHVSADGYVPGLQQGIFRDGGLADISFYATCAEADRFSHTLGTILADVSETSACQARNELTGKLETWPQWGAVLYEGEMYFEGGKEYNFFGCVDDLVACELDGVFFWCEGNQQVSKRGVRVYSKMFKESGWHPIRMWLADPGGGLRGAWSGFMGFQNMGIGWNTNGCKIVNGTTQLQWNRLLDDGNGRLLRSKVLPQKSVNQDECGPVGTKDGEVRVFGAQDGLPIEIEMVWVPGRGEVEGFWMSKDRITQWQYKIIMGYNPVKSDKQDDDAPVNGFDTVGFIWNLNARYTGVGRFARMSDTRWKLAAKYCSVGLPLEAASLRVVFKPVDRRNSEREEQKLVKRGSDIAFETMLAKDEAKRYSLADGLDLDMIKVEGCGDAFYLGRYEVTQEQYEKVMASNPSGYGGADNMPVSSVNWANATEFCQKLNSLVPVEGMTWTLPSTKQWSFAANGGLKKKGNSFFGGDDWHEVGWWGANEYGNWWTHPVGLKKPNELGFHDLFGNVWEWCCDDDGRKDRKYISGAGKGAWYLMEFIVCVNANRNNGDYGFRVALVPVSQQVSTVVDGEGKESVDGYTWSYRVKNGEAEIYAVMPKLKGEVVIPSALGGVKMTSIGNDIFTGFGELTAITIPLSVKKIGDRAFSCCGELASVTIPKSVVSIGGAVFAYCGKLKQINLDAGNMSYTLVNGLLCTSDRTKLVMCPPGRPSATIPGSVTDIGHGAFIGYCGSPALTVPRTVKHIADWAFSGCGLASITLPEGLTKIEDATFWGCGNLASITIPKSVTSIGGNAFRWCGKLKSVTIPKGVKDIGGEAFIECGGLESVTMCGERPNASDKGVFQGCGKLKAIHVPANAKSWAGMKEWQGIPLVFDAEAK